MGEMNAINTRVKRFFLNVPVCQESKLQLYILLGQGSHKNLPEAQIQRTQALVSESTSARGSRCSALLPPVQDVSPSFVWLFL